MITTHEAPLESRPGPPRGSPPGSDATGLSRRELFAATTLTLVASALLVVGWRLFWFLTDDAFIAFRYVSNSVLGHGYVWNAEPFRPVEGYTSFLWVALLDAVWRLFGVRPPDAANALSLGFSIVTLALGAWMVLRLSWSAALRPARVAVMGLVLLGVVSNRTFLTWSSSGFETALFNLLLLVWVFLGSYTRAWAARSVAGLSAVAALLALTRPDGLLYVAATVAIVAVVSWTRASRGRLQALVASAPLLLVVVHLIWRQATYGLWLPNTYYAKVFAPWPAAGMRFALSFVMEYALWFWPLVAVVGGWLAGRGGTPTTPGGGDTSSAPRSTAIAARSNADVPSSAAIVPRYAAIVRLVCLTTVVAHVLYYLVIVGGDHFEYRILSHLVVPILVSFAWLVNRLFTTTRAAVALLALFVALSWPVPWTHWALTRDLETRAETRRLRMAIAPHWPGPVRGYATAFDRLQSWLIERWIAVRHQEHKVNQEYLAWMYPTRAEGERISGARFPVHAFQAVGVAAWSLPHVYVIDLLGLNDPVIARAPADASRARGMAHERQAPEGYAACFRPNVFVRAGLGLRVVERDEPLTAEMIRDCESTWLERIGRGSAAVASPVTGNPGSPRTPLR